MDQGRVSSSCLSVGSIGSVTQLPGIRGLIGGIQVLGMQYTRIIYVESFARVTSLSLSGTLVRRFVDSFLVQWPDALGAGAGQAPDPEREKGWGKVQYRGWLV